MWKSLIHKHRYKLRRCSVETGSGPGPAEPGPGPSGSGSGSRISVRGLGFGSSRSARSPTFHIPELPRAQSPPAAGAPPRQRPAQPAASAPRRQPRGVKRPAQPAASPPQKRSRPSEGEERRPPKKAKLVARLRWLQSLLPIRPEAPESWLQRRVLADGSSRWGCKVCAVHAVDGISLQLQRFQLRPKAARLPNLRRHGQSQAHAVATKAHLSGVVDSGAGATLPEDFHSVWHRLAGRPVQNTFSRSNSCTIEWCILQAVQDQERAFLAKAKCISVAMDERKGRLLVTYAACRGTAVRSGVLAQLRSPGRSADMTAACVAAAARRLCTIRKPHPHMNKTRKAATIDSTTLQHILDHVEMFTADGAANEQVAGRLLHPSCSGHPGRQRNSRISRWSSETKRTPAAVFCRGPSLSTRSSKPSTRSSFSGRLPSPRCCATRGLAQRFVSRC